MQDGPEKKELGKLEQQLLVKLKAAKAKQAKDEELTNKDLRLEIGREGQTVFIKAEQRRHAQLREDADRTRDPQENDPLEAYEAELLARLKDAYVNGLADPMARFDALTVDSVRAEIRCTVLSRLLLHRGTPLFQLSPLDWALVETWKDAGVPVGPGGEGNGLPPYAHGF